MNLLTQIQQLQRSFSDRMAEQLHLIHDEGSFAASAALIAGGFLYGVFHAVGPGHGKVLVSGYVLASDSTRRRALIITLLSALMQAVVAIVIVLGLYHTLGLAREKAQALLPWFEMASYALILLIGLWLIWRALTGSKCHHHHAHHGHCHHHHPTPENMMDLTSTRAMIMMIVSIGIRPCSGALLVLFLALLLGLLWSGILAALAMALGTAFSTSIIALVTFEAKRIGLTLATSPVTGRRVRTLLALTGGVLLTATGALFLAAAASNLGETGTIAPAHHPLMHQP